jgi:hypothetical protein
MAKTPYTIDYAEGASEDLANLRAYACTRLFGEGG